MAVVVVAVGGERAIHARLILLLTGLLLPLLPLIVVPDQYQRLPPVTMDAADQKRMAKLVQARFPVPPLCGRFAA